MNIFLLSIYIGTNIIETMHDTTPPAQLRSGDAAGLQQSPSGNARPEAVALKIPALLKRYRYWTLRRRAMGALSDAHFSDVGRLAYNEHGAALSPPFPTQAATQGGLSFWGLLQLKTPTAPCRRGRTCIDPRSIIRPLGALHGGAQSY
jgi:hypothetical protein